MLNRPFRNVGEFGYALRPEKTPPPQTIDFATAASADAPILDLFTYNTAATRAGIVNLNTTNPAVFAALLKSANLTEAVPSPGVGLAAANQPAAPPTPKAPCGVIGYTTLGTLAVSSAVALAVGAMETQRVIRAGHLAVFELRLRDRGAQVDIP